MSRFILGDCVQVMSRFPARAVDFILTDPPYLVGYKDRTGRTLAGDNSAEWLQPACHEMYRVLKNDSLMVSFYAWNRADLFLNAWKTAGFRVVGHMPSVTALSIRGDSGSFTGCRKVADIWRLTWRV